VVGIVFADANDFRRCRRRQEFHGIEWPFAARAFTRTPEFAEKFVNGSGFHNPMADFGMNVVLRSSNIARRKFERLKTAEFHGCGPREDFMVVDVDDRCGGGAG